MKILVLILLLFLIGIIVDSPLIAANRNYTTNHINSAPPKIDGLLEDSVWEEASWTGAFTQTNPNDGALPSEKTVFKILYDNDNLYVAIRCYDSKPEEISLRATRRDGPLDTDMVGILLDSYFDKRTSFEFYVTPAGVKNDRILASDQNIYPDSNWDPIWYVKTNQDEEGWTAEMRIPFTQLRYATSQEMLWGLQVARYLYRIQEYSYWQYIPRNTPGWASYFGQLQGLKSIKDSYQIEILPYFLADYQTFEKEVNNPFRTGNSNSIGGGLDGKIGINSNLTVDFTVNPDFGQVEADPSVVNLTAFETRFIEKRPFFIEGRNILNFSLPASSSMANTEIFYSRRIGRFPQYSPDLSSNEYADVPDQTSIKGALKLTGRTSNGLSIGILNAVTAEERAVIALSQGGHQTMAVEPLTNYFVGRLQKEYNEGTTIIGGAATATNRKLHAEHLNFLNEAAYTGGFNVIHRWNDRTYYTSLYTTFSHIRGAKEAISLAQTSSARYFQRPDASHLKYDPNRTSLSGHGGSFSIGRGGNSHWLYELRLNWRSPELELNDLGFMQHADLIQERAWLMYRIFNPVSIVRSVSFSTEQLARWNFNGDHLFNEAYIQADGQFVNYWKFFARAYLRAGQLSTTTLRGGPAFKRESSHNILYKFSTDSRKKLILSMDGGNYWSHSGSQNHNVGFGVWWRPIDVLSFTFNPSYRYNYDDLQWVTSLSHQDETRYIFSRIEYNEVRFVFRLDYNITPTFTVQYYGQPFVGSGKHSSYKRITNPRADTYKNRFHTFTTDEIQFNDAQQVYQVDEDQDGTNDYEFGNPDFNFVQFRSNLVVRWEYIPGSTLYLVWSQERSGATANANFVVSNNLNDLFEVYPHNIFLIKVSHWFSL